MLVRIAEEILENTLIRVEDKIRTGTFPTFLTIQVFVYLFFISFILTIAAFVIMYYLVNFLIPNVNASLITLLSLVVIVPILTIVTARLIVWLLEGFRVDNLSQSLRKSFFVLFSLLGLFLGPFISSGYILTLFQNSTPVLAQTSFVLPAIAQYFSISIPMFLKVLTHNLSVAGVLLLLAIFLGEDAFFILLYNAVALATLITDLLPKTDLAHAIANWLLFTIMSLPHMIPEFLGFLAFYLLGVYISFRYWEPLKEWLKENGLLLRSEVYKELEEEIDIIERWQKKMSGYYVLMMFILGVILIIVGAIIEVFVTAPIIRAILKI